MLLAEAFVLLALDADGTLARGQSSQPAAAVGVTGALITELVQQGHVDLAEGRIHLTGTKPSHPLLIQALESNTRRCCTPRIIQSLIEPPTPACWPRFGPRPPATAPSMPAPPPDRAAAKRRIAEATEQVATVLEVVAPDRSGTGRPEPAGRRR